MDDFERVKPWIQQSLNEGGNTHSLDDIRAAIASGAMRLLTSRNAAILLEIVTYPQKRALRVFGVGGNQGAALRELQDFAKQVPTIAKETGCTRFEGGGRWGWVRALKPLGMTSHAFMFKDI